MPVGGGGAVTQRLVIDGDSSGAIAAVKGLDAAMGSTGATKARAASLVGLAKAARPLAYGIFAALAVGAKVGFDEMQQGEKVAAQTAAVLKSTGGVAKVTAADIEALGDAGLRKSGVDDELIKSGANVLLTFTQIRNEAGAGNDIFNQASSAALDLSVALGKDLKGANILVGKALNDPIKGLTALGRVGVRFTADQQKQIKTLVESGRVMEAQKIILAGLEQRFGGSAAAAGKTLSGQLNIAKESFANLAGEIMATLLPSLTAFAGALAVGLGWLSQHQGVTKVLVAALAVLATTILTVSAAQKVAGAATAIWTGITKTAAAAQWLLNAALRANPIGIVITALAALVAGLIYAYRNSETFRNIVQGAFAAVAAAVNVLRGAFNAFIGWLRGNWKTIAVIISGPFAPLVALATDAFGIRSRLIAAFQAIVSAIKTAMSNAIGAVRGAVGAIGAAAAAIGRAIVSGVFNGIAGLASLAGRLWALISGGIGRTAATAASAAAAIGRAIVQGVWSGIQSLAGWLQGKIASWASGLVDGALGALGIGSPSRVFAEKVGRPIAQGIGVGIEAEMPTVTRKLTGALRKAVKEAGDSAMQLASDLSSRIGTAIDAGLSRSLAVLDQSPEAVRLRSILATQRQQQKADERARLDADLAGAATPAERAAAQKALNDWLLDQERQALEDQLAAKRDALQTEADTRKTFAERSIADLTDQLNRGLISQRDYNTALQGILAASGVDYQNLGSLLGTNFANGFVDAINALIAAIGKVTGIVSGGTVVKLPGPDKPKVPAKKAPKREWGIGMVAATGPAILHAGETVLNRKEAAEYRAGRGGGQVSVTFADGMGWLRQFMRVEVNTMAEGARRSALAAGGVR